MFFDEVNEEDCEIFVLIDIVEILVFNISVEVFGCDYCCYVLVVVCFGGIVFGMLMVNIFELEGLF